MARPHWAAVSLTTTHVPRSTPPVRWISTSRGGRTAARRGGKECVDACSFRVMAAYEMRISDGSSDVCSSDLHCDPTGLIHLAGHRLEADRDLHIGGSHLLEHGKRKSIVRVIGAGLSDGPSALGGCVTHHDPCPEITSSSPLEIEIKRRQNGSAAWRERVCRCV